MRVISKRKLRDYYIGNPQAKLPLVDWYYKVSSCGVDNITQLKKVFNSVDAVYGYTIFNIGGNNYRLITAIHYNKQICYVRTIWTHAEYSKKINQQKLYEGVL